MKHKTIRLKTAEDFPIELILTALVIFVDHIDEIEQVEEYFTGLFNRIRVKMGKKRTAKLSSIPIIKYFNVDGVFYGLTEMSIDPEIKISGYYNQRRGWYKMPDGSALNVKGGLKELSDLLIEKKMI